MLWLEIHTQSERGGGKVEPEDLTPDGRHEAMAQAKALIDRLEELDDDDEA